MVAVITGCMQVGKVHQLCCHSKKHW
jgi:hypothetical protein